MGDAKQLKIERLLALDPSLKSVNRLATRGGKCMDVIITDIGRFYQQPIILPPIAVDDGEQGVPSDHNGVQFLPKTGMMDNPPKKERITVRPMPQSLIDKFGRALLTEDWRTGGKNGKNTDCQTNIKYTLKKCGNTCNNEHDKHKLNIRLTYNHNH